MGSHDLQLIATADGSYTLHDAALNESYHSKFGARSESDQVFLRNAGVLSRLQLKKPTSVLEIGFGTGFNFTRTAISAINSQCNLHYTALESQPLPSEIVVNLLTENNCGEKLSEFTANALQSIKNTDSHQSMHEDFITIRLIKVDACLWNFPIDSYDAIYLDAFSSKNNPQLWQAAFLGRLRHSLRSDGMLATYGVNRRFRDALENAGWQWKKLPGPKGKREVLIAGHAGSFHE